MAVPDYQNLMLPLLQFAARKGTEISTTEALETLAKELSLTEDDLKEMLPSRIQSTFANRVGWASTYMKKAGLLEATRRGFYQITDRGRELLGKQPKTINVKLLKQYPEFLEFKQSRTANVVFDLLYQFCRTYFFLLFLLVLLGVWGS